MDTITLYRQSGVWMARHSDPTIRDLFGTDALPTAYTDATPAGRVWAALSALNPGVKLTVRV